MPVETTVGKILLKNSVPDKLKSYIDTTTLDKKGIGDLFGKLAHEHSSEEYRDAVTKLARLGFETATRLGSTVPMEDLIPKIDKEKMFADLDVEIDKIKKGPGTKQEKDGKIIDLYAKFNKELEKAIIDAGLKHNHTLAKVIVSGSRGSPMQYRQTVAAPVLVSDEKGRPILDFPIRHSFAEGLTIPEYLLHSYGTRSGAISTKLSIADSGYASKQLSRAAMPIKVEEHDCGTDNGITVSSSDKDSIGTFLAKPVANYKKNNEVTGSMLTDLKSRNISDFIIRSPITCQSSRRHHAWAVCQLCAGKREKGTLPPIGDYLGVSAASALGEPLCVIKGTKVRMADLSIKNIEDINPGEYVLGSNKLGNLFPVKVLSRWENGKKLCRNFNFVIPNTRETYNIATIGCTDDHKLLLKNRRKDKFKIAEVTKTGNEYGPAMHKGYTPANTIHNEYAFIIGLLIGDGCLTQKNAVYVSCFEPSLLEYLGTYLADRGLSLMNYQQEEGLYYISSETSDNKLNQLVKQLGLAGKKANLKTIPKEVFHWDQESILELISGIVCSDGCFSYNEKKNSVIFDVTSTSKRLLDDLWELLALRLGIILPKPYTAYLAENRKDVVYNKAGRIIRHKLDCYALRTGKADDIKLLAKLLRLRGKKLVTLNELISNDAIWDKSRKSSSIYQLVNTSDYFLADTYDLEVDHPDHLYVLANHLVIKNSQGQLNQKHASGSAQLGKNVATGFKLIQQLLNIPHTFQNRAAVAAEEGTVTEIKKAPQGGFYITVRS